MRTAAAKGLSGRAILFKHGLKNALIPVVTVVALSLPGVLGGAIVTETIFAWPGAGRMFYSALAAERHRADDGVSPDSRRRRRVCKLARRRALRVARPAREIRLIRWQRSLRARNRSTKTTRPSTPKSRFWTRLRRHKLAVAGIVVLGLIALCAIFAHLLAPFDPNAIDNVHWQGTPLPPCFQAAHVRGGHPLGTDEVGRDLLSRLLFGARISLQVGIFTVLFEVIIGVIVGAFAGYYGGWVDWVIMRITDVFLSIPLLPLLLVLDRDRRREFEQSLAEFLGDRA